MTQVISHRSGWKPLPITSLRRGGTIGGKGLVSIESISFKGQSFAPYLDAILWQLKTELISLPSHKSFLVSGAVTVVVVRIVKAVLRAEKQASNGKYNG